MSSSRIVGFNRSSEVARADSASSRSQAVLAEPAAECRRPSSSPSLGNGSRRRPGTRPLAPMVARLALAARRNGDDEELVAALAVAGT
ncbi:hypothetical protein Dimus_027940, partial [Dionaea muscipula]